MPSYSNGFSSAEALPLHRIHRIGVAALVLVSALPSSGKAQTPQDSQKRFHRIQTQTPHELQHLLSYSGELLPLLSAHRGGALDGFPENCVATFENTLEHTFAILEIDPRLTKDGAIVIHHDATLERTTTGQGRLADYTLPELKLLHLKDTAGNVTPFQIPTLDEVLQWARGKTILVLDQKDVSVAARVKKIEEHHAGGYAILIVYSFADARACYKLNPNIVMEVMIPNREKLAEFERTGIPWRNVIAFVGHTPPKDPALYGLIHQKGASCIVGTSRNLDRQFIEPEPSKVDELEQQYRTLFERGADLIETDIPTKLGPLLHGSRPIPSRKQVYFSVR